MFKSQVFTLFLFCAFSLSAQHSLQRFLAPINTAEYDEICPIMSYEEDYMFFTRTGSPDFDRTLYFDSIDLSQQLEAESYEARLSEIFKMISGKHTPIPHQSSFNQDVWFTLSDRGRLANVIHPGYPINSALPNSICSTFGSSGDYVIVNQFFADGSLKPGFSRISFDGQGNFNFPKPLYIDNYSNRGNEVNLSMSNDGEFLFISLQDRNSKGDQDLYVSRRLTDSIYTQPYNLSNLNTSYRESTPFISKDKKRLFFASNRPGGYGKMDIYVSERLDYSYKEWSKPTLLKQPLNSAFDDSHPYVGLDENTMLFTSNRDGSMDIFRAKIKRDSILNHDILVKIRIMNEEGLPVSGDVNWTEAYDYEPAFKGFFRPRDGHYTYTIKTNIPHTFYASKTNQISQKAIIDPQEFVDAGITEYYLDLYLGLDGQVMVTSMARDVAVFSDIVPDIPQMDSITAETENEITESKEPNKDLYDPDDLDDRILNLDSKSSVLLKNIYFTRGRYDVLPSSFPTLKKLSKVMIANKNAIIQIEGHTDNIGNKRALKQLSQDRAQAIKAFLVKNGVLSQQIRIIGFGPDIPLTSNETELDRRRNRRVEIRVLQGGKGKSN